MGLLEEFTKGARVRGVAPIGVVTVIDAEWIGSDAVNLTYEDDSGNVEREIVYRSKEVDFDKDTRWAVAWYTEFGFSEGSAGIAETLSKAKNTSIGGLVTAGVLH